MPKVVTNEYVSDNLGMPINKQIQNKIKVWDRTETFLNNDEDEILKRFMIELPNESNVAFNMRKDYFVQTFINTAADLLTSPVNSIFAQDIKLSFTNENSMLKSFSENVTRSNDKISYLEWLKNYVALNLRAYGNVVTLIAKPAIDANNKAEERAKALPYLKNIRMQDVLNWQTINGKFVWFAYKSCYQKSWINPIKEEYPEAELVEYIWTTEELIVRDRNKDIINDLSFRHNYGFVPIIVQASFLSNTDNIIGNAAFDNTANMLITFNNLIHTAVHELYKHGSALLLRHEESITAQSRRVDQRGNTKIKKQDNDSTLEWGGEQKPEYLIKDLQVGLMKELASFYLQQAILNERDLKSVTKIDETGISEQSGVAKAYDLQPLKMSLNSLAIDLEHYTEKTFEYASLLVNESNDSTFNINKEFDLKSIADKYNDIILAMKARLQEISPTLFKEQIKTIVPSLVSDAKKQKVIYEEIESMSDEEMSLTDMLEKERERQNGNDIDMMNSSGAMQE